MTVSYTAQVATCRGFGCFLHLLLKWRGSIYKLMWRDLSVFLVLHFSLSMLYRKFLDGDQQKTFEAVVKYCDGNKNLIPVSFVLGFYVSVVMARWWNVYLSIPKPGALAVFVSATIHGQDERGRVMRRTIMRYVCLAIAMVLGNLSPRVKKRFPTLNHYVEAGMLIENEKEIMDDLNLKFPKHSKHWLPLVWAAGIVTRARKEGRVRDDFAVKTIIDELNKFRGKCGILLAYDSISVPLVYTQVVTIAVYSFFVVSLMGHQRLISKDAEGDILHFFFPVFSCLQFFFYMGWLKVAEQLINPFGEDDDDFEVNWMIDKNLQESYLIVDDMHHDHPELLKDQYWDSVLTTELPYTVASMNNREQPPEASTANIAVPKNQQEIITSSPSSVQIDKIGTKAEDGKIDSTVEGLPGARWPHVRVQPNSVHALASNVSRARNVSSVFKRLLNKNEAQYESRPVRNTDGEAALRASMRSIASAAKLENARNAKETIQEGDEQAAAAFEQEKGDSTSMTGRPSSSTQPESMKSADNPDQGETSETSGDFEKLKQEREQAAITRQMEKMVRNVTKQKELLNEIELQQLLQDATQDYPSLGEDPQNQPKPSG